MLNLTLCSGCPKCLKRHMLERGDDGELVKAPSVECELAGSDLMLFGTSDPPESCLYFLEQTMTQEEAWNEHEDTVEEI